jgi:hypothetical protein
MLLYRKRINNKMNTSCSKRKEKKMKRITKEHQLGTPYWCRKPFPHIGQLRLRVKKSQNLLQNRRTRIESDNSVGPSYG